MYFVEALLLLVTFLLSANSSEKYSNVPNIKKYSLLKRKLFATVSNDETTTKTADVRVEGQMAKWNQNLHPLSVFYLSLQSYG
jgi:hypothetical protein